ncbi:MAG TPA: glycosyltransferase family 1 protein [Candidatus Kapabacteria bacterium]|nr:glycosyltransferase family 1 protein [Candidatus Kapabacteria bacterium]
MKLVIVTDAWHPQINGVVTTMTRVVARARQRGFQVELIDPSRFTTVPCPRYENEIRLAVDVWRIVPMLKQAAPDFVHIVSEGPLGLAARLWLSFNKIPYTSAYHTRFPEYVHNLWPVLSVDLGYRVLRRFHANSRAVFVPTASLYDELAHAGFDHLRLWSRGVDAEHFHPCQRPHGEKLFGHLPQPWFVYVGRVAPEKNLQAFLQLELPGSKIVVGDGPAREALQRQFPASHFTGFQSGVTLAGCFAAADVFVFPSRTDTFGVVLLEAMASGTPVAAFPVTGPKDVVMQGKTGFLSENLAHAALKALQLERQDCRQHATQFTWARAADMLLDHLAWIPAGKAANANHRPLPGLQ